MNYLIDSMKGLGDNIFQRHVVKALGDAGHHVWVATPWPELYKDFEHVRFVLPATELRTQRKNLERLMASGMQWTNFPKDCTILRPAYNAFDLARRGIIKAMERRCGFKAFSVDLALPDFGPMPAVVEHGGKPVALLRPVTERSEWLNTARNPDPGCIVRAAEMLREAGYWVVGVADLAPGKEWLVDPVPDVDQEFLYGELNVSDLMALTAHASIVVGGVGWIVPACVGFKTPLYCVLGGMGGHNAPNRITDPRMDLSNVRFATPDAFCMCADKRHACNKTITNFDYGLGTFLKRLATRRQEAGLLGVSDPGAA